MLHTAQRVAVGNVLSFERKDLWPTEGAWTKKNYFEILTFIPFIKFTKNNKRNTLESKQPLTLPVTRLNTKLKRTIHLEVENYALQQII